MAIRKSGGVHVQTSIIILGPSGRVQNSCKPSQDRLAGNQVAAAGRRCIDGPGAGRLGEGVSDKPSAGMRSDLSRDCRDAFLGLGKACARLGMAFWDRLGSRLRIPCQRVISPRPDLARCCGQSTRHRRQPGVLPLLRGQPTNPSCQGLFSSAALSS